MISELLTRSYVISEVEKQRLRLQEFLEKLRKGDPAIVKAAGKLEVTEEDIEKAIGQLDDVIERDRMADAEDPGGDDSDVYIPNDPEACMFQIWAEETAEKLGLVEPEPSTRGLADSDVIFTTRRLRRAPGQPDQKGQFGDMVDGADPLYLFSAGLAKMLTGVRKNKRPFNPKAARTCHMKGDPRLLLMGDWASGIERAQAIGRLMRADLERGLGQRGPGQREQHVIHLGDTYYSGWPGEYEKRFLPWWPVLEIDAPTFGSWSLNGNHDMYSGGSGYFDTLLREDRFSRQQDEHWQPSSFFLLENENWQVFGLDTSWLAPDFRGMNGDLFDGQAAWMAVERQREPKKGCVLLTHHQLFSARHDEGHSLAVEQKLSAAGVRDGIDAWIWGHEHRCVVHQPGQGGVPFSLCLGHSGVPVKVDKKSAPLPSGVAWEYRDAIEEGFLLPRLYARFGYATLDFRGPEIHVRIVGDDGAEKWPLGDPQAHSVIRKAK